MDLLLDFLGQFTRQLQSPTLSFLIGGFLVAAMGSKLSIPNPIYQFVVFVLLMKIGMKGGVEIREAQLADMLLPAFFSACWRVRKRSCKVSTSRSSAACFPFSCWYWAWKPGRASAS